MSVIEDARREILAKQAALTKANAPAEVAPVTSEQTPPPETPAAEAAPVTPVETPVVEGQAPAAETPPAAEPETQSGWNKPLQKLQMELANSKKEHARQLDEILARLDKRPETSAAPVETPTTTPDPIRNESVALREKVKAAREDPYTTPDVLDALLDRQEVLEGRLKARDDRDAEAQRSVDGWTKWSAENPGVPLTDAQALRQKCLNEATAKGYTGDALRIRSDELFTERLPDLKKKPPAPSPAATTPQTAPAARVSTPAGVRVTPVDSGVRSQPRPNAQPSARKFGNYGRAILGLPPK